MNVPAQGSPADTLHIRVRRLWYGALKLAQNCMHKSEGALLSRTEGMSGQKCTGMVERKVKSVRRTQRERFKQKKEGTHVLFLLHWVAYKWTTCYCYICAYVCRLAYTVEVHARACNNQICACGCTDAAVVCFMVVYLYGCTHTHLFSVVRAKHLRAQLPPQYSPDSSPFFIAFLLLSPSLSFSFSFAAFPLSFPYFF